MLYDKPLETITKADLAALVAESVSEGRRLDFKQELPGKKGDDKKEFARDVSSFANGAGGLIVYGLEEANGAASRICGVSGDPEQERLRLGQLARGNVAPKIPGLQTHHVECDEGTVILLRVPKSWAGPHMVAVNNDSRFYVRTGVGKVPLDVDEIRSAFAMGEAIPERLRAFRDRRLGRVLADEGPVELNAGPKLVFHAVPVTALDPQDRRDVVGDAIRSMNASPPFYGSATRYNADGYLYAGDSSYTQVFRDGSLEVAYPISPDREGNPSFASQVFPETLTKFGRDSFDYLRELGLEPPVFLLLSLLGVKGVIMHEDVRRMHQGHPVDRDDVLLPDLRVDEWPAGWDAVTTLLRPWIDQVWQATGHPRCYGYGKDGVWRGRRR